MIVGGDGEPTKRGVVSTANYEARKFGVHSAMPLRTAYKQCPQAVFLPVDADAGEAASRSVMATLRSFEAVGEVAGWDEAFLETDANDPSALAREIQRAVLSHTRLWCSIGVGDNKLGANLASGFAKPRGVFELTRSNWDEVMAGQPTSELWGVGSKTARRLEALGIRTVEQLGVADEDDWPAPSAPERDRGLDSRLRRGRIAGAFGAVRGEGPREGADLPAGSVRHGPDPRGGRPACPRARCRPRRGEPSYRYGRGEGALRVVLHDDAGGVVRARSRRAPLWRWNACE